MTKLERDFFKYCCRQANYEKCEITTWTRCTTISYVKIVFKEFILNLCRMYAREHNEDYEKLKTISTVWLRHKLLRKRECDDVKEYAGVYYLCFESCGNNSMYYNLCPSRVIARIPRRNEQADILPQKKETLESNKISGLELKLFRYLLRENADNITITNSGNDTLYCINIPDAQKTLLAYNKQHISKRYIKILLNKWIKVKHVCIHDETKLDTIIFLLESNNLKHVRYINAIPKFMLKNKN